MPKAREHYYDSNGILRLKCGECGEFKNENDFYPTTGSFHNLTSKCKICMAKAVTKWGRDNPNKRKIKDDRYREKNSASIKIRERKRKDNWKDEHGYYMVTLHKKAQRYIRKYKLRPIECPICGKNSLIQFHHVDYTCIDKWNLGVFCCAMCHKKIHCGEIECPEPIKLDALCNLKKQNEICSKKDT